MNDEAKSDHFLCTLLFSINRIAAAGCRIRTYEGIDEICRLGDVRLDRLESIKISIKKFKILC